MRKCTVCSSHSSPSSRGLSRERKTKALHAGLLQQQEGDGAAAGLKLRSELSGSSLHGTFLPAFPCVNKPLTQEAQSTPGDQLFFNCLCKPLALHPLPVLSAGCLSTSSDSGSSGSHQLCFLYTQAIISWLFLLSDWHSSYSSTTELVFSTLRLSQDAISGQCDTTWGKPHNNAVNTQGSAGFAAPSLQLRYRHSVDMNLVTRKTRAAYSWDNTMKRCSILFLETSCAIRPYLCSANKWRWGRNAWRKRSRVGVSMETQNCLTCITKINHVPC